MYKIKNFNKENENIHKIIKIINIILCICIIPIIIYNATLMIKSIIEKEKGNPGEIFLNFDLNKKNPIFRERV